MIPFLEILAAYIIADALSAWYHVITDWGWNIPSQVKDFRNHHDNPLSITMDWRSIFGGIPIAAIGYFYEPYFFVPLGLFLFFATITHYYAHFPAPWPLYWLQNCYIILPYREHQKHHTNYTGDFCVLSGWNNWWINLLVKRS